MTIATKSPAKGITTVYAPNSTTPECHANSGYGSNDLSGSAKPGKVSARNQARDTILAFWESQGVARWVCTVAHRTRTCDDKCVGHWEVRDMVNGGANWLPMATRDESAAIMAGIGGRSDVAEMSHITSAGNGGAFCGCGVLPEAGDVNAARGQANIPTESLSPSAVAVLAAWPSWWVANRARKASLARLGV